MEETQVMNFDESFDRSDIEDETSHIGGWIEIGNKRHELKDGSIKVGRDPLTCKIVIGNEKTVSKEHALLEVDHSCVTLMDLGSRNKTRIGKMVLKPNVRYALQGGEKIKFGAVQATFITNEKYNDSDSDTYSDSVLNEKTPSKNKGCNESSDNSMISPTPQISTKNERSKTVNETTEGNEMNDDSLLISPTPTSKTPLMKQDFFTKTSLNQDAVIPETPAHCSRVNESPFSQGVISQSTPFTSYAKSLKSFTPPGVFSPILDNDGKDLKRISLEDCTKAGNYDVKNDIFNVNQNDKEGSESYNTDESTDSDEDFLAAEKPEKKAEDDITTMATQPFVRENEISNVGDEGDDDTQDILNAFNDNESVERDNTQDVLEAFEECTQKPDVGNISEVATQQFDKTSSGTIFKRPFVCTPKTNKAKEKPEEKCYDIFDAPTQVFDVKEFKDGDKCNNENIFDMPTQVFDRDSFIDNNSKVSNVKDSKDRDKCNNENIFDMPTQVFDRDSYIDNNSKVSDVKDSKDGDKCNNENIFDMPTQVFDRDSYIENNTIAKPKTDIYEAPTQVFDAPTEIFEAPTQIFEAPTQIFDPSKDITSLPEKKRGTIGSGNSNSSKNADLPSDHSNSDFNLRENKKKIDKDRLRLGDPSKSDNTISDDEDMRETVPFSYTTFMGNEDCEATQKVDDDDNDNSSMNTVLDKMVTKSYEKVTCNIDNMDGSDTDSEASENLLQEESDTHDENLDVTKKISSNNCPEGTKVGCDKTNEDSNEEGSNASETLLQDNHIHDESLDATQKFDSLIVSENKEMRSNVESCLSKDGKDSADSGKPYNKEENMQHLYDKTSANGSENTKVECDKTNEDTDEEDSNASETLLQDDEVLAPTQKFSYSLIIAENSDKSSKLDSTSGENGNAFLVKDSANSKKIKNQDENMQHLCDKTTSNPLNTKVGCDKTNEDSDNEGSNASETLLQDDDDDLPPTQKFSYSLIMSENKDKNPNLDLSSNKNEKVFSVKDSTGSKNFSEGTKVGNDKINEENDEEDSNASETLLQDNHIHDESLEPTQKFSYSLLSENKDDRSNPDLSPNKHFKKLSGKDSTSSKKLTSDPSTLNVHDKADSINGYNTDESTDVEEQEISLEIDLKPNKTEGMNENKCINEQGSKLSETSQKEIHVEESLEPTQKFTYSLIIAEKSEKLDVNSPDCEDQGKSSKANLDENKSNSDRKMNSAEKSVIVKDNEVNTSVISKRSKKEEKTSELDQNLGNVSVETKENIDSLKGSDEQLSSDVSGCNDSILNKNKKDSLIEFKGDKGTKVKDCSLNSSINIIEEGISTRSCAKNLTDDGDLSKLELTDDSLTLSVNKKPNDEEIQIGDTKPNNNLKTESNEGVSINASELTYSCFEIDWSGMSADECTSPSKTKRKDKNCETTPSKSSFNDANESFEINDMACEGANTTGKSQALFDLPSDSEVELVEDNDISSPIKHSVNTVDEQDTLSSSPLIRSRRKDGELKHNSSKAESSVKDLEVKAKLPSKMNSKGIAADYSLECSSKKSELPTKTRASRISRRNRSKNKSVGVEEDNFEVHKGKVEKCNILEINIENLDKKRTRGNNKAIATAKLQNENTSKNTKPNSLYEETLNPKCSSTPVKRNLRNFNTANLEQGEHKLSNNTESTSQEKLSKNVSESISYCDSSSKDSRIEDKPARNKKKIIDTIQPTVLFEEIKNAADPKPGCTTRRGRKSAAPSRYSPSKVENNVNKKMEDAVCKIEKGKNPSLSNESGNFGVNISKKSNVVKRSLESIGSSDLTQENKSPCENNKKLKTQHSKSDSVSSLISKGDSNDNSEANESSEEEACKSHKYSSANKTKIIEEIKVTTRTRSARGSSKLPTDKSSSSAKSRTETRNSKSSSNIDQSDTCQTYSSVTRKKNSKKDSYKEECDKNLKASEVIALSVESDCEVIKSESSPLKKETKSEIDSRSTRSKKINDDSTISNSEPNVRKSRRNVKSEFNSKENVSSLNISKVEFKGKSSSKASNKVMEETIKSVSQVENNLSLEETCVNSTRRTTRHSQLGIGDDTASVCSFSSDASFREPVKRKTRGNQVKQDEGQPVRKSRRTIKPPNIENEVEINTVRECSSSEDSQKSISTTKSRRSEIKHKKSPSPAKSTRSKRSRTDSPSFSDEHVLWSPSHRQAFADKHPRVLFTTFKDAKDEKIVTDAGGKIAESASNCTVLVTNAVKRTCKLLACIGKGIPIVSTQWLVATKRARCFVDPWKFIVSDEEAENKFGFRMEISLKTASKKKLFSGYSIHITDSVKPPPNDMREIIECAGGQYLEMPPKFAAPKTVIVSCDEDKKHWNSFKKLKLNVVDKEFILTGLLRQKLMLDEFKVQL